VQPIERQHAGRGHGLQPAVVAPAKGNGGPVDIGADRASCFGQACFLHVCQAQQLGGDVFQGVCILHGRSVAKVSQRMKRCAISVNPELLGSLPHKRLNTALGRIAPIDKLSIAA